MAIEFKDDGKGKWQSVSAILSVPKFNIEIEAWGKDRDEALSNVLDKAKEASLEIARAALNQ